MVEKGAGSHTPPPTSSPPPSRTSPSPSVPIHIWEPGPLHSSYSQWTHPLKPTATAPFHLPQHKRLAGDQPQVPWTWGDLGCEEEQGLTGAPPRRPPALGGLHPTSSSGPWGRGCTSPYTRSVPALPSHPDITPADCRSQCQLFQEANQRGGQSFTTAQSPDAHSGQGQAEVGFWNTCPDM